MLRRHFCGTTSSVNPTLHSQTKVRAKILSEGVRLSASFLEEILEFLFGGQACKFGATEVHDRLFEFQTACADVAAEIIKGFGFRFWFFTGPERNGRNSGISVLFGQILTKI
jgi:hypothetical protein